MTSRNLTQYCLMMCKWEKENKKKMRRKNAFIWFEFADENILECNICFKIKKTITKNEDFHAQLFPHFAIRENSSKLNSTKKYSYAKIFKPAMTEIFFIKKEKTWELRCLSPRVCLQHIPLSEPLMQLRFQITHLMLLTDIGFVTRQTKKLQTLNSPQNT